MLYRSANGGHPAAQYAQTICCQIGLFATPVDLAETYLWARVAELRGDPRAAPLRERLAADLDPARKAEIDARYATWSPAPCPEPAALEA